MAKVKEDTEIKEELTEVSTSVPNKTVETVDSSMITVTFRDNRKFDLHIGRNIETFTARQTKKIPRSWIKHKDWQNVAKYFVIKGV